MPSATEERAGGSRGDDGEMHVYRSSEGSGWARLCVVADRMRHRADAVLPPAQATGFADEIDRVLRTKGRVTAWWGPGSTNKLAGASGSARVSYFSSHNHRRAMEVRGRDGGTVFILASDKALSEVSVALREVSQRRDRRNQPIDCADGAKRRTDDNLRRVFGG